MKSVLRILPAAAVALGLAMASLPAAAQQPAAAPAAKPSAAAIASARQILEFKHASDMYGNAVPGMVQKVKDALIGQNLNYQKDLNEVAPDVAKALAGREKEIGEGMAQAYASEFTEQELKELVTFFNSPLGKKLIASEPKAMLLGVDFMKQWAQNFSEVVMAQFRAEMHKRGKDL